MADAVLNILVSRLRFIGDIVLTTPVVEVLRGKFPDAAIDYLGDKNGVTLLQNNPNLNEIIPYDFSANEVHEQIRIASILRKKKYDVAVDLFGNPRSAIVILLSGAKMRIGGSFGWRRRLFTHPITVKERMTSVAFHLKYLEPLGIHETYRPPKIFLTKEERGRAEKELTSLGIDFSRPVVGIHLGATWPAKVWLSEYFARLANMVVDKLGGQILVTYGSKDLPYFDKFSSAVCTRFTPVEPRDLRRLASVISACNVYVSNDAAPMHISAAVGTPTVGIFGPGEPDIWFPYDKNPGHVALHKDVPCCHRDFCERKGEEYMQCMKAVKPEEVLEVLKRILQTDN
jgi:lipopolysaccharide heptosyltransferase II